MPVAQPLPGSPRSSAGQASVELVALLPLIAVIAGLMWQAVLAGQAVWLSGTAARAAARAQAVGEDPLTAARRALPDGLRGGVRVGERGEDGVRVRVAIPTIVGGAVLGTVDADAHLRSQAP